MAHADDSPVPPAHEPIPSEVGRSDPPAETHAGAPEPPAGPDPATRSAQPPRVVLLGATFLVSGFVFLQVPTLWDEWQALRRDWETTRQTTPIGYVGIAPSPNYARPPEPWAVHRVDALWLWSGWIDGVGHSWFKVGPNDLDVTKLGRPMGRDVIRAIDVPLAEVGGGEYWGRLQHDTPVVGVEFGQVPTAYPMLLLAKVEIVNDTIGDRPVLIVSTPFQSPEESVDIYDPVLDGQRIQLASSGHFVHPVERHPLLYDRDTESFWIVGEDHELSCVAGARKGARLRHLGRGQPVEWGDWVDEYPGGRLIVGANRETPPSRPLVTALPSM